MKIILLAFFALVGLGTAQVPVVISPAAPFTSILQNGNPNGFGCVFTYQSGTTAPLSTYTDNSGVTLNANPVVLSAAGTGNIWLQAGAAYTFVVKSSGGVNCASGSTVYTVNGIGGGSSVQTTQIPPVSAPSFTVTAQLQLFTMTLISNAAAQPITAVGVVPPAYVTIQLSQVTAGGHTMTWPSNVIGGCVIGLGSNQTTTQDFVWDGTDLVALAPCTLGAGTPNIGTGSITANGTIFSSGGTTVGGNLVVDGNATVEGSATVNNSMEVNKGLVIGAGAAVIAGSPVTILFALGDQQLYATTTGGTPAYYRLGWPSSPWVGSSPTFASTSFATAWTFPVIGQVVMYHLHCDFLYHGSATTAGPKFQITQTTTSLSTVFLSVEGATNGTAYAAGVVTGVNTANTTLGTIGAMTTVFPGHVDAWFVATGNGSVNLQVAANGSGTLTLDDYGTCRLE